MCGRYYRTADKQQIADAFRAEVRVDGLLPPGYNIAPSTTQPVIRQAKETGTRELAGMRWGLVGYGSKGPDPKRSTFNAKSENLVTSGLWRVPLHKRRCLVPVSGFYEWRKSDTVPFRFTLRDQPIYAFAGLWDAWKNDTTGESLQSFSIITVPASPSVVSIHDRSSNRGTMTNGLIATRLNGRRCACFGRMAKRASRSTRPTQRLATCAIRISTCSTRSEKFNQSSTTEAKPIANLRLK